jgi:hypothetical protein
VKFDSEITNRAFTGIKTKNFGVKTEEIIEQNMSTAEQCRWREFYRQFRYYRASGKK